MKTLKTLMIAGLFIILASTISGAQIIGNNQNDSFNNLYQEQQRTNELLRQQRDRENNRQWQEDQDRFERKQEQSRRRSYQRNQDEIDSIGKGIQPYRKNFRDY